MKVQELRQFLSVSDRENLEKALVETYKQLRKGQKEDFDSLHWVGAAGFFWPVGQEDLCGSDRAAPEGD